MFVNFKEVPEDLAVVADIPLTVKSEVDLAVVIE